MEMGSLLAQALKSVWVGQHFTPLLGQRGAATGDRWLLSHAHLKHLLGFLSGWRATQGRHTQRDLMGILDLPSPVLLGHAEKRVAGIGADRQADLSKTELLGGLEWVLESGSKLAAHRPRGARVDQGLALGQRVMREALRVENLLARQQRDGILSKPLDQRCARG